MNTDKQRLSTRYLQRPAVPAMRLACGVCGMLTLAAGSVSAQVTFNIAFDASASVLTPTEKTQVSTHLQEAGRRWVNALVIGAPRAIEVTVSVSSAPTANGGSATSVYVGTINGRDTYEQGVAAELRTGVDPNGAASDANVTFGLNYLRNELWFDPDPQMRTAPVPANRTDAMSTVLHELGHILVYNGWADVNTGQPPATYWSIWDRWMIPGQPTHFSGPDAVVNWGSMPELTIGNINHWANPAQGTSAGTVETCASDPVLWKFAAPIPRRCMAPASADAALSTDPHRATSAPASGNLIDQLMNGVVFYRGTRYDISPLDLGVLRDAGFSVDRIFANNFEAL